MPAESSSDQDAAVGGVDETTADAPTASTPYRTTLRSNRSTPTTER